MGNWGSNELQVEREREKTKRLEMQELTKQEKEKTKQKQLELELEKEKTKQLEFIWVNDLNEIPTEKRSGVMKLLQDMKSRSRDATPR